MSWCKQFHILRVAKARLFVIPIVIVMAISLCIPGVSFLNEVYCTSNDINQTVDTNHLSDSAVIITSDSDFISGGWLGTGMPGDPYVIDNQFIDIQGLGGNCIEIRNTCAYFSIENCVLIGGTAGSSIVLSNVINGRVYNNTCSNNVNTGIQLLWSSFNNISNNYCYDNWRGIEVTYSSNNNTINNNTIMDNIYMGLFLDVGSENTTVEFNTFVDNAINARDDEPSISNTFIHNYWSDYGVEATPPDIIGNIAYNIAGDAENTDDEPYVLPPTIEPLEWDEQPTDQETQWGKDFAYDLNATAYVEIDQWWLNDTSNFAISQDGVITNSTTLPESASYGLKVIVNDTYNNLLIGEFNVAVQDTSPPEWIQSPEHKVVEFGDFFIYDLNASDPSGLDDWWIDDVINFAINETGKVTNASYLDVGVYPIQVWVNDTKDYVLSGSFTVTVEDTVSPSWVGNPINQIIEFGDPFSYKVNATDLADIDKWWLDGSEFFSIDADGIISNSTITPVGGYSLSVSVNDTHGQIQSIELKFIIQDTISPTWLIPPTNQIHETGTTLGVQFNATDLSGIMYWSVNDTANFGITSLGRLMNNGIVYPSIYTIEIVAFDIYENSISQVITVEVQDNHSPTWDRVPNDITKELGYTIQIQLEATDPSGIDSWWLEDAIQFSIDAVGEITNNTILPIGEYSLAVFVNDTFGHILTTDFDITIRDTTAPSWLIEPTTQIIREGELFQLQLSASDLGGAITWVVNDTAFFSISESGLLSSESILVAGTYAVEITITDPSGNSNIVEFKIVVEAIDDQFPMLVLATGGGIGATAILVVLYLARKKVIPGKITEIPDAGALKS